MKINSISNNPFDQIFPSFGQHPAHEIPTWNEGQKLYIVDEYESDAGNRYYKGMRFCDNLAIVETFGNYHSWTYINSIEIFAFDGKERRLAGKREYDKHFYDTDFIKSETKEMVHEYILAQSKLRNAPINSERAKEYAGTLVDRSYTSLLDDNYLPQIQIQSMLTCFLPQNRQLLS